MLSSQLTEVLAGMVLVGIGTFFAQALQPALLDGQPLKTAASQAGPISPAISLVALWAAQFSGSFSTAWDGPLASPVSAHRLPWPHGLRRVLGRDRQVSIFRASVSREGS
jgi:hypothetical protein